MSLEQSALPSGTASVRNIGGIEETEVEFSPGVTVLSGRNTTNRTSFLQAVMAALGSDDVAVKGDAEEARVELTLGEETYTRTLRRESGTVVSEGDPYLDDPELAELFGFLLESNEPRQAVARGDDLRDLIMRPVDTDAIQAKIDSLVEQRESLKDELAEIDDLKGRVPQLEEKRTQLQADIEAKKEELEETEQELESRDADVDETSQEKSTLETKLQELRTKRSELADIRYDLETEREGLESLKQERAELEQKQEELPDLSEDERGEIASRIESLRRRKQRLETEVNELQSVIGFNEEMLEGADGTAFEEVSESSVENLTDQVVEEEEVTCWTCGTDVDRSQIESTVTQLRELSQDKVGELNQLESEIDELQSQKQKREQSQRERERITRRLDELQEETETSEAAIDRLQNRREELTGEIETLEAQVDELEDHDQDAVLELHKEANQLEYELGRLETDLERVEDNLTELEDRIDDQDDIEAQLEEVKDELQAQGTKIERLEKEAIEQFNEHMDAVLERLSYTNIDRIWLERVEQEVREGRRKVSKSVFEMHVIRSTESGVTYEDTIDHLSESEREATGLVFALSGYLTHELYDTVPFILLDSLEAIDSERIASLVDYMKEYTDYLIVALLPEDASALSDEYDYVDEI